MAVKIGNLPTRALHEAFVKNVEACEANGIYTQQLAALLSIPQDVMYKMREWSEERGRPHIFPWPDRIARLTDVSGDASYLTALNDSCGYFAVPKPSAGNATYTELCEAIQSNAEMVAKCAAILQDGVIDPNEARTDIPQLEQLIDECQRDLEGLRAKLVEESRKALSGPNTIAAAERFSRYGK